MCHRPNSLIQLAIGPEIRILQFLKDGIDLDEPQLSCLHQHPQRT